MQNLSRISFLEHKSTQLQMHVYVTRTTSNKFSNPVSQSYLEASWRMLRICIFSLLPESYLRTTKDITGIYLKLGFWDTNLCCVNVYLCFRNKSISIANNSNNPKHPNISEDVNDMLHPFQSGPNLSDKIQVYRW